MEVQPAEAAEDSTIQKLSIIIIKIWWTVGSFGHNAVQFSLTWYSRECGESGYAFHHISGRFSRIVFEKVSVLL